MNRFALFALALHCKAVQSINDCKTLIKKGFSLLCNALHSEASAKPSKTLGFLRFAPLQSLHSLKGGAWAVQSPAPLPLGAAPGGFRNA